MIDTQAIRSKILNLAMRGQLTEQLPEDGAAASFIARNTSKKTAGMMDAPFEIPSNWIWTSIEEITVPVGKKTDQIFADEVKKLGKYPAISQGERFIDGYTDEEKAIVDLPLIVFGDHTKNVKFVDFPFVICADGVKCLKVSFPHSPKYIFYWMKHASCAIEDRGYARHYSLLKKYPVPLPPLAEQQRIVEKIGQAFSVLDTIDALQARHAGNLAALRAKLIDAAIRGKLTEQLPEDGAAASFIARNTSKKTAGMMDAPFEIPSNWIWTSIEEITVPVGKKTDQIFADEVKKLGKYPAISQGERFIDGYTDEEKAIVDLPLIVFGDHTKNVKFVDFPFVICADGVKCLKVSFPHSPKYIFYWMKHASCAIEDRGYARHYSLLKKYPVPLPPLAEQQRIVARLDEVLNVLEA